MPFSCKVGKGPLFKREDQTTKLEIKCDYTAENLENCSLETTHAGKMLGHSLYFQQFRIPVQRQLLQGIVSDTNLALSNEVLNEGVLP